MTKKIFIIILLLMPVSFCFSQDGVMEKLQGMWGSWHMPQDLYYFDGKTVTHYSPIWPEDGQPLSGLNYTKSQTVNYKIEKLNPSEGLGYRITIENGSTYWLLEKEPDILYCYWYKDGELYHSGSDSLDKVEISVDELTLY